MKHLYSIITALFCLSLLSACSSGNSLIPEDPELPNPEEPVLPSKPIERVNMMADNILSGEGQSRTAFTLETNKLKFGWAEGDVVGVYPTDADQTSFTIKSGAGTNSASFDGGAWALRTDAIYAAYYPYSLENSNRSNAEIRFDYSGQTQDGNGSLASLGTHDFMATQPTLAVGEELSFNFKHLNSVVQFRLSLPVEAEFTSLILRSNSDIFTSIGNLNLSGSEYVYTSYEQTNQLEMSLNNIATTANNKELIIYMMLFPIDLTTQTVQVVLKSSGNRVYQGLLGQKNLQAGYAYSLGAQLVDVTMASNDVVSPDIEEGDDI